MPLAASPRTGGAARARGAAGGGRGGGTRQGRPPARVQRTEERLDHRRLDAVVNSGAVAGEVAEAQIGADGDADRNEDLGARAGLPGLNPAEIRCIDPGRAAQRRDGDVRVETHPPEVLARGGDEGAEA